MGIRVTPFQLMQWRMWLKAEQRLGRAIRHSGGSVKARAARTFGLSARTRRDVVLAHVEGAIAACQDAKVPLTHTVSLEPKGD